MNNDVSLNIRQQVANIASKFSDKTKIDSKAEMAELGKLLNGQLSDADRAFVEQKLEEGRQNTANKLDKRIDKDKVSKFIKNVVSKIASLGGDKKKVDTEDERSLLNGYLNDKGNELSESEKEYIKNEVFRGSDDIPQMPKFNKKTGKYSGFGI